MEKKTCQKCGANYIYYSCPKCDTFEIDKDLRLERDIEWEEKEKKEKYLELLKSLIYIIVRKERGQLKDWEFDDEIEPIEEELKKYL